MATPENIEYLRQCAHEEQLNAAYEQRRPDRVFLDQLGSMVLHDKLAVACVASTAYYLDFDEKKGHTAELVPKTIPVSGRFGGFWIQPIDVDYSDVGTVQVQRVNYFVLDTTYNDIGFMCPVESTKLIDVEQKLEYDDDFTGLLQILTAERIELSEINEFFKEPLDKEKIGLYISYLRSAITPSEVVEAVYTDGLIRIQYNDQKGIHSESEGVRREAIKRSDVFTVGSFNPAVGIELAIRRGRNPGYYMPLSLIVGHDIVNS